MTRKNKSPQRFTLRLRDPQGVVQMIHNNLTRRTAERYTAVLLAANPGWTAELVTP